MAPPKPSVTALLVCDMVIEDKTTNKKSLIGAFTDIWAPSFPCIQQKMGLYFCLTDAEGDYDVMIRVVQSETENKILEAGFGVHIVDRLSIYDFGLNLPMLQFPDPGRYEIQLFANKEFLGRKEFRLSQLQMPPTERG
ncbi:MAG TPA: hypothetical protein VFA38_07760 [Nitrospirales bacterium]|nr:hypothetical protein [Nitrospirales bacterium]